jgi:hypothetical protein
MLSGNLGQIIFLAVVVAAFAVFAATLLGASIYVALSEKPAAPRQVTPARRVEHPASPSRA